MVALLGLALTLRPASANVCGSVQPNLYEPCFLWKAGPSATNGAQVRARAVCTDSGAVTVADEQLLCMGVRACMGAGCSMKAGCISEAPPGEARRMGPCWHRQPLPLLLVWEPRRHTRLRNKTEQKERNGF